MNQNEEFGEYCLIKLNEGDEQINAEEDDETEEKNVVEEVKEKEESEQKFDKLESEDKDLLKKGKRKISVPKKLGPSKKKYDTYSNDIKRRVIKDVNLNIYFK